MTCFGSPAGKRCILAGICALLIFLLPACGSSGRENSRTADSEGTASDRLQTDSIPEASSSGTASSGPAPGGKDSTQTVSPDGSQTDATEPAEPAAASSAGLSDERMEEILSSMTDEEKAAQLFIILPEDLTGVGTAVQAGDVTKKALAEYPVGGLIYMENNIRTPEQITKMLANTRQYSLENEKIPIFLGTDEEGGSVTRIAANDLFDVPSFPSMNKIGAAGNTETAYELGRTIGTYLKTYGFNIDFAPDADVLSNPENKVIGDRSFGSDPETVWNMASGMARGLEDSGIVPVYKHFPGHGATGGDTHKGLASTDKTLDELLGDELIPFQKAAEAGAPAIMTAHISLPSVTGDDTPASLSKSIVTGILRERFGYQGLVMTDAMNMGAVSENYSSKEAAVLAIEAGCDMVMMPSDFHAAYTGVLEAVASGRITEERLNESLRRILRAKAGLFN